MKITVRHRFMDVVLFEYEGKSIKEAVEKANLARANLARANLDGANLARANLARANLDGANLARANLDGATLVGATLARANLDGANLDGANLDGATLVGATLVGANLVGATLVGAEIQQKLAQIRRNDGYEFIAFLMKDGQVIIRAGCRTMTVNKYRDHVSKSYPDTPKAIETLAILDYIDARLREVTK